ncbi:MAG TPA: ABC transporter permease [Terriglobia bacterium]|nr:ABC transporter permease [Terriglobia bacterium]
MTTLLQDVRYGLRMLAKNPGFTAVAVLTLALGIGANTAIFSLIDTVMLRSLPVREPSQLVVFRWTAHHSPGNNAMSSFGDCAEGEDKNPSGCSLPYPYYEQVRAQHELFSGVTAFAGPPQLVLTGDGPARMAQGELVSGDYFSTLGVSAVAGRTLGPDDDSLTATPAVVLSYTYWKEAFGGDRAVLGRTINLNAVPFTIVGVAEPRFTNLSPGKTQDLFLSLSMLERLNIPWQEDSRTLNNWWLVVLARLKPGISPERAQVAVSLLFRNQMLHGEKPLSKEADDPSIVLMPAQSGLMGERGFFSKPLYVLMGAVGLILLIACANVGGLLLSRGAARQKELAVRQALGAGRGRVVRQLLTESVTLSLAGGALGVLLAFWGIQALTTLIVNDADQPFPFVVGPDWRVLAFTIGVSILTGILFGLAPAFRSSRIDLSPTLKENAPTNPAGEGLAGKRLYLGNTLVVIQVALSTVVLVGAGLLVRTLQNLHNIDPGFDTRNVLFFGIDPTLEKYKDAQIQDLYRDLHERLGALPGVISVAYSSFPLLNGSLWTSDLHVEGQPEKSKVDVDMLAIGTDFFKTMRIPLVGGRTFTPGDFQQAAEAASAEETAKDSPKAGAPGSAKSAQPPAGPPIPVVVNQAFVLKYFPGANPLGKQLTQGDSSGTSGDSSVGKPPSKAWTIVGIVGDTRYNNLKREIHPMVFVPVTGGGAYFELRTATDPASLIPAVRKVVNQADKNLPLFQVRTQTERIEELLTQERVVARLSSFFGVLAMLLACIGLYGLLSYEVARRTREIGIRMALGAERLDVTRLILVRGMRLTLAGVIAGIACGLAVTRVMSSLLFDVKPTDLPTYLTVALLLGAVSLLASYLPARRATQVDPMVALRYE